MSTRKIFVPVLRSRGLGVKCTSAIGGSIRRKNLNFKTLFPTYANNIQIFKQYSTDHILRGNDGTSEALKTTIPNNIEFSYPMLNELISQDQKQTHAEGFLSSFTLCEDYINPIEESNLLLEVQPHLERQVYEKDHWDEAIVDFRETERKHWNHLNSATIKKLQTTAFNPESTRLLPYVHVLDLAENGFIKPHIDSSRFCGDTVAVISLLSDSVLKLVHEKHENFIVHVLVPRRSLYVLRGISRYDYTHAILKNEDSYFKGNLIKKERRISIVCRNEA